MFDRSSLAHEATRFDHLRRHLIETYPDIDDETLFDTLEGASNLNEAVGAIVRSALEDEALVQALKARIDGMRERLSRIQHTASSKRLAALEAMEQVNLKKIVEPDFTISVRPSSPGVVVTCEAEIPDCYTVPQPPKINRRKILDALKAGADVPGAVLSNSRNTLSVRTK
ncbi:MAG: siphovirus Gp157 family protein [Hyphomicrobiales bacterium]|nr:siphovirus Gp157 family protein [Hyphomicrobiales bacterium]